MRILIVGGTGFLGGATARAALDTGHDVTVMTRSGDNVAAGATTLIADRDTELPDMRGQFDAVIDTCAYAPDMVARLGAAVGKTHYIFVSSISVYDDLSVPHSDETTNAPPATKEDLNLAANVPKALRGTATPYGAGYGRLKRSCEIAAKSIFDDGCALIRLGLIVGPGDYTDRFTWWVRRCDEEGDLHLPAPTDRLVQVIDVRDAAAFLLHLAQTRGDGIYHVTGQPITIQQMLDTILAETGRTTQLTYAPLKVFTDAGLECWTDLPFILPDDPTLAEMMNVSTRKAEIAGLTLRPLKETVRAVLNWDRQRRDKPLTCGMSREVEAGLELR